MSSEMSLSIVLKPNPKIEEKEILFFGKAMSSQSP